MFLYAKRIGSIYTEILNKKQEEVIKYTLKVTLTEEQRPRYA